MEVVTDEACPQPHAAGAAVYRWGVQSCGRPTVFYLLLRSRTARKEWGFPKVPLGADEPTAVGARRALRSALGVELELEPAAGVHALSYTLPQPTARCPDGVKRTAFHVATAPAGLRTSTDGDAVWLPLLAAEIRAEHAEMRELLRAMERAIIAKLPPPPVEGDVIEPEPTAAAAGPAAAHAAGVEGDAPIGRLGLDLLTAVLNHTDARALAQCWAVDHTWHAATRAITARALQQLDAIVAGAPLRASVAGARPARGEPAGSEQAELRLSADDVWWLSQLHPPLLRAQLERAPARLPSMARVCFDLGVGVPEPGARLPRLCATEASRMARAASVFDECERAPARPDNTSPCTPFGDELLQRVAAETLLVVLEAEQGQLGVGPSFFAACRFVAQLCAHDLVSCYTDPFLKYFARLIDCLEQYVESHLIVISMASMAAVSGGEHGADGGGAFSVSGSDRRAASDTVVVMCELCANFMMLQQRGEASLMRESRRQRISIGGLQDTLSEFRLRWDCEKFLSQYAANAIEGLLHLDRLNFRLPDGHPGIPALGIPGKVVRS